jgi:hypothetical protein
MTILSVDEFSHYIRDEKGAVDAALVGDALSAAEQDIHNYCQRKFVVAAGPATARLYVPNGTDVARIHDCTTVTAVSDNGTAVTSTYYQLEPVNGLSWAGETVPYDQIRYLSGCWSRDGAKAVLSITATWGWAAIPDPVKTACKILADDVYKHRDNVLFGLAGMTEAGGVRAGQAAIVTRLLAPYKRVESIGIA